MDIVLELLASQGVALFPLQGSCSVPNPLAAQKIPYSCHPR